MPRVIESLDPDRDTWISQAEFIRPNRRVVYLLRLNLCFVDLDTYKTSWKGYPPDKMANIIWGFCQDEDIPEPSLILFFAWGKLPFYLIFSVWKLVGRLGFGKFFLSLFFFLKMMASTGRYLSAP